MRTQIDITGQRFERWSALAKSEIKNRHGLWLCECDCGTRKTVSLYKLIHGRSKSCGCLRDEIAKSQQTIHGLSESGTWNSWVSMKKRCKNTKHKSWKDYGGRGISFCDRWNSFELFLKDMGERPEGHSIERIDVNGNYTPENCVWLINENQAQNKRNSKLIRYKTEVKCIGSWERQLGFKKGVLRQRLARGWPLERAFNAIGD
ncbi:MAG: hypothetical protein ACR2QF_06975 [Geminicoccaceae bacterium]